VDGERYPKNGYGIMCFLEANPQFLPEEIIIVSSNPVGRNRMQTVIDNSIRRTHEKLHPDFDHSRTAHC